MCVVCVCWGVEEDLATEVLILNNLSAVTQNCSTSASALVTQKSSLQPPTAALKLPDKRRKKHLNLSTAHETILKKDIICEGTPPAVAPR